MTRPAWYPSWQDQTVVIVASGPSAALQPLDLGIGRAKFVAINRSILLAPWSSIWYCCDFQWWDKYFGDKKFRLDLGEYPRALKVSVDYRVRERPKWGVKFLFCEKPNDTIVWEQGKVGWGGNSGFNALNMVAQFKPAKIILIGFDMSRASGTHWHDPHPADRVRGLSNPTNHSVERWRRVMENAAREFVDHGITVINCSAMSALQKYRKMSFEEALEFGGAPMVPVVPTQVYVPPDPVLVAEKREMAEAVVKGVLAKTGNRPVPEKAVEYLVGRVASRL